MKALAEFQDRHISQLTRYPHRYLVLLIDFDRDEGRFDHIRAQIPESLIERVFIIGAWSEPEALRAALGSYESIGKRVAETCRDDPGESASIWNYELLRHNENEVKRMQQALKTIVLG